MLVNSTTNTDYQLWQIPGEEWTGDYWDTDFSFRQWYDQINLIKTPPNKLWQEIKFYKLSFSLAVGLSSRLFQFWCSICYSSLPKYRTSACWNLSLYVWTLLVKWGRVQSLKRSRLQHLLTVRLQRHYQQLSTLASHAVRGYGGGGEGGDLREGGGSWGSGGGWGPLRRFTAEEEVERGREFLFKWNFLLIANM